MKNAVLSHMPRVGLRFFISLVVVVSLVILLTYSRTAVNTGTAQSDTSAKLDPNLPDLNGKYNLMDANAPQLGIVEKFIDSFMGDCSIEYMNMHKLQQDHPCVIETIRELFLNKPSPPDVPLKLDLGTDRDRSSGQTGVIFKLLNNMTDGFFVECGALDGEYLSNTIDLERKFNWSGILIEANPLVFRSLLARNRKSWTLPICLSLEPYPTQVSFQPKQNTGLSHIEGEAKTLQKPRMPGDPEMVTVQCFPFYSVLLAVNRTQIDFFSLDVEGHELQILQTIPWHKVDIKTLTVEWDNIPNGKEPLIEFMEQSGYLSMGAYRFNYTNDIIFVKNEIKT